jgi:glucokinase
VIAAALAGEPSATAILDEIAGWIGLGLVNLIAFFGPQEVIVGGGLGARCFSLISPVATTILERHRAMVPTDVAVVPAETGDDAGILGAAFAALQRVR